MVWAAGRHWILHPCLLLLSVGGDIQRRRATASLLWLQRLLMGVGPVGPVGLESLRMGRSTGLGLGVLASREVGLQASQ